MAVEITEKEMEQLHQKISDLNNDTFELREQVAKLVESNSSLSEELERQTKTLIASQVAKECPTEDDSKKKSRFTRFVDKVKDTKDMVEMQAEIDILQAKVAQHESEATRLQAMEMNTRHLQTFAREAQMTATQQQQTEKDLRKKVATLQGLIDAQPELGERSKVVETETQLADATQSLEEKQKEFGEIEAKLAEREEVITGLRANITSLQMDVDSWRKKASGLDTAQASLEEAKAQMDCAKIDTQAWKEQCQHLQRDMLAREEAAEAAKVESQKSEALIDKQAAELEELRPEPKLRKEAEASLRDMAEEVRTLTQQLEDGKLSADKHSEVEAQATSLRNNVASMKEGLKIRDSTIAKERAANEALTEQLAEACGRAEEGERFRQRLLEAELRAIVVSCASDAAWCAEHQRASELGEASAALQACRDEKARLQHRASAFDQRLADMKSEHKIMTRKKDNLIRELQSQLKAAEKEQQMSHTHASNDLSSVALCVSPSANSLSQSIDVLSIDAAPAAVAPEVAVLQKEEIELIQKVASLKEANWKLEEEKRNQQVAMQQLQEDNDKKNTVIGHWLSGPAAEQLLSKKGKLLQPQKQSTAAWLTGMAGSSKQQDINQTLQKVVQDTIAENIQLTQRVDQLEARLSKAA
eukprot:TRINITY_DN21037_c0_g1_i1.p1 TRINITY_DN21037_c0_g1~~TRINITY_DN21037_c0_g1_i1.p1  ORF type:complete len:645 (+),score=312.81 TRINITY_DN21037_c0_g1_i1:435-2369(+)